MNERIARLAAALQPDEAALVLSQANRLYYTGFASDSGLLWVTAKEARFLTDFRYIEAAKKETRDLPCKQSSRFFADAFGSLKHRDIRRVLLEDETVTLQQQKRLLSFADGIELVGDRTLCKQIWSQRRIKDQEEISRIKAAQVLTDETFSYILPRLRVGRTEREIALEMEMYMRSRGAQAVAFDFIVAFGENGSLPHAVPGERRLQKGDFVTMDFGAAVDGYRSDMTRTVALGQITEEQRFLYDTVLAAQERCLCGLKAGLTGEEGDRLAREVIEQAGFGASFGHSTGHGVGIDIHEWPRLSPNDQTCLQAGEIVTVEPGIYLEGRFGVRIEDMVCITQDGCENLTCSEKKLIVL